MLFSIKYHHNHPPLGRKCGWVPLSQWKHIRLSLILFEVPVFLRYVVLWTGYHPREMYNLETDLISCQWRHTSGCDGEGPKCISVKGRREKIFQFTRDLGVHYTDVWVPDGRKTCGWVIYSVPFLSFWEGGGSFFPIQVSLPSRCSIKVVYPSTTPTCHCSSSVNDTDITEDGGVRRLRQSISRRPLGLLYYYVKSLQTKGDYNTGTTLNGTVKVV